MKGQDRMILKNKKLRDKRIKEEIERRYKRKVISHPEGAIVHNGDCDIYNMYLGVCTCGLRHMLLPTGLIEELYPMYHKEKTREGLIHYFLQEFQVGNLFVKDKDGNFVKIEEPKKITDEQMDKILKKFKKKE